MPAFSLALLAMYTLYSTVCIHSIAVILGPCKGSSGCEACKPVRLRQTVLRILQDSSSEMESVALSRQPICQCCSNWSSKVLQASIQVGSIAIMPCPHSVGPLGCSLRKTEQNKRVLAQLFWHRLCTERLVISACWCKRIAVLSREVGMDFL